MVAKTVATAQAVVRLFQRALCRVGLAMLSLLRTALRPTAERSHRMVALLLLGSMTLLAIGAVVGTKLSTVAALGLCLTGALGLLVSGLIGSHLDSSAGRPSSGDFPMLRR